MHRNQPHDMLFALGQGFVSGPALGWGVSKRLALAEGLPVIGVYERPWGLAPQIVVLRDQLHGFGSQTHRFCWGSGA